MVDFSRLVGKKQQVDVSDPLKLFNSLDRQSSHITLRPVQEQILREIHARRGERDLVLKMSTGAGKTAVALIYLKSYMAEKGRPGVYLCPKTQLVDQVVQEAQRIGIKAIHYAAGEPHPGAACMSGQAVAVCTYAKLFNAKTSFDREDVLLTPIAVVLDDAHAGIEEVRDSYTLRLSGALHEGLLKVLSSAGKGYMPAKWASILDGDPEEFLEVPYWLWKPVVDQVIALVSPYANDRPYCYVWPYLRDNLRWCRCIICGSGTEIVPDIIPLDLNRAYSEAAHRLYMSGTLADDSLLVRELGCSPGAARKPIAAPDDNGIGERMVLVPTLVNGTLTRDWIMGLCGKLASRGISVVVLCSSEKAARDWGLVGAKVALGNEVDPCVNELRAGSTKFAVFAQRYDGIDLPDNACRVLVIDGMPYGQGIADKYDSRKLGVPGGIRNRLIYRIEQGMGRAVRSHADYAVVILSGPELANFIGIREVVERMNPATRAQLELATELANLVSEEMETTPTKAFVEIVMKCLNRDESWKQLYNNRVRGVARSSAAPSERHISLAAAEQEAARSAMANNSAKATEIMEQAITSLAQTEAGKGWLMQKSANYLFETDAGKALEKQRFAYDKNKGVFCPPEGITVRPPDPGKFESLSLVLNWYKRFANPNAAIAQLLALRARLSYDASPKSLEQAVLELAEPLGAIGLRPEEHLGVGPDDLWLWPEVGLVIEVHNDRQKTLPKKDSGQLHDSLEWYNRNYRNRESIPLVVAKVTVSDQQANFPSGTRILTPTKMAEILDNLDSFVARLIKLVPLPADAKEIARIQSDLGLLPEQFVGRYTVPIQ